MTMKLKVNLLVDRFEISKARNTDDKKSATWTEIGPAQGPRSTLGIHIRAVSV